ncbi:serine-rich adhesin for platelets [Musca vetustissima]|uniref:serine-rich adhesin for platelets n=1 Tax=Musca vetustissima TaxID=27455 RepID=UPI002AB786E9|nr:serine-rich adhesin for platelets [Musca vetustissima]
MFELEEYSSGFHDGFLNKYADSSGPTLDFFISDSLHDMLDVDIRSEVANVVGSVTDYETCLAELPSAFDHSTDLLHTNGSSSNGVAITSSSAHKEPTSVLSSWSSHFGGLGSSNSSSSWLGANNDFLADVGACVNPISVMPLISSSLLHMSPKTNLNANILRSSSPPPPSPNVNDTKSHLTFSPAHIKISASSIRNEQLTAHIPKQQIIAISSTVTTATTAPATMATNSALQRKNAAVEAIKKDLGTEMRKVVPVATNEGGNLVFKANPVAVSREGSSSSSSTSAILTATSSSSTTSSASSATSTSSSTIKLGPGIGGLTFANNITTYNKLKQTSNNNTTQHSSSTTTSTGGTTKLNQGSTTTITANGSALVLKRERESSPLQTITTNGNNNHNNNGGGGQNLTKIISRNGVQTSTSFTAKSIAHANYLQQQHQQQQQQQQNNSSNGSQNSNYSTNIVSYNPNNSTTTSASNSPTSSNSSSPNLATAAVKPLQQKVKPPQVESEFPKPAYSYSCLIAMALKNSRSGSLPVSEIYSFMCEHFPYFKTAPSGWKNSVRHNLSLNKCFEKIEKPPTNGNQRKGCLWAMNPERIAKMDEEVQKWSKKDPMAIRNAMVYPEHLEALERGEMKHGSSGDSDAEMDSQSEIEEASDLEEQELDETLVDNMLVEEELDEDMIHAVSIKTEDIHHMSDNEDDSGVAAGGGGGNDIVISRLSNLQQQRRATMSSPITLSTKAVNGGGGINSLSDSLQRDFDIEVEDIYDAIDIDDDKEAVRMAISQSDIIELSPADYNISAAVGAGGNNENHQSPKRARLNINYSIGPAGEIEKQIQNQQQQQRHIQMQNIKKIVKVQNIQDLQHIQQQLQQQQQQIVVQTISSSNNGGLQQQHQHTTAGQFTQIGTLSALGEATNHQTSRRKMQLVNRIA